ncbi:hypothetical protein Enr13x_72370 [Stieleria neptunia]|uniref:Uncharacterized protein n=1 Tax=Stieleria neptunia TaxID=2527979 RepID=A0A518I2L1_9BACT|nr:polymorphic toxin-type HINT domain-containing protein [Stieleria neptunia]QDV47328.1 hypothetical protein Enr13x_72370 [Stieleria neptunia]
MSASNKTQKSLPRTLAAYTILVLGLAVSARLIFGGPLLRTESTTGTDAATESTTLASLEPSEPSQHGATTRPIESIRVGDRVLAENPEIAQETRETWKEPDWTDWVQLTLEMPLSTQDDDADPPVLQIEILRPEQWFIEQVGLVVAEREPELAGVASERPATQATAEPWHDSVPYSPLRDAYRHVVDVHALAAAVEVDVLGLTVEMDLPEMGAVGTAVLKSLQPCPPVKSSAGQVVTATFAHPPTTQVLEVVFEGESERIGVTDNHLFWSVDRQAFVPIGKMEIGERVVTFHGDTKRIESRLPRPGPQLVYNLEVYGEHVYFVGDQGLLVHNAYSTPNRPNAALEGRMVTGRTNKAGEALNDLFEFANPTRASRQGLGFAEELHHFWPKWLGGPEAGPLLNVRMGIHRGAGVGMHQRLNDYLVSSGMVPRNMINNSAWVRQNLTPSQIKRALYQFYRTNYSNLPGVPKLLNDAAKSVKF